MADETRGLVDRAGWTAGPWDDEPDRVDWTHAGFPCMALRSRRWGNWCGYVGVAPGHPWHGREFMDVDADVHGGLTYSAACRGEPPTGICHVPADGEHDARWWLGFDCGHAWDLQPAYHARHLEFPPLADEVYRRLGYVRAEVERLAEQAASAPDDG